MSRRKWQKSHTNKRFLKDLRKRLGTKPFTNQDAYEIYHRYHKHWIWDEATNNRVFRVVDPDFEHFDWYWEDATVRNYLCHTVYHKLFNLVRVGKGIYQFTK
jgi:hypothetical protein